ncbi:trypsin-like peptidase domain-containing protein [Oscillospiraceae bacterium NSJ-54]|uniref:Trypsin-like peptidase domain-containing protein n=2 Tax=Zongyangia hominis TaxID=2763677 RepID=A0A926IBI8_9FIRM|nr:trypsin-like peptidase domain-containing protein [Zongyangia hominis]
MSVRAAAVMMAVGITAAGAAGFGGGYLANSLAGNHMTAPQNGNSTPPASTVSANTSSLSVAQIAEMNGNSVVEITTESVSNGGFFMQQYISSGAGSGVIISEDGYIITNNHVIEGASTVKVRLKNGDTYDATLVGTDAQTDVAVIKIDAKDLTPVTMGDSDTLQVGQTAVAIGNPLGELGGTVTNGIISALDREITLDGKQMNLLQTNAAINPGNSGGGLFNDKGELIGLVVAKSTGENVEGLGFAIPVNDVKNVIDNLIDYGYVKGRFALGVTTLDITSQEAQMKYQVDKQGVYVQQVNVGGNAELAGIQAGDRIVSVDGTAIESGSQLKDIIQSHTAGDKITMVVERNGQQVSLAVTLAETTPNQNGASGQNDASGGSGQLPGDGAIPDRGN